MDAGDIPSDGLDDLLLVADSSIDEEVRTSVAVNFKNHLQQLWSPASENTVSDAEKENIRELIVSVMINSNSPKVQSQLMEAVSVIGHDDFPGEWPSLLLEIVENLNKFSRTNDYAAINSLLTTADSLFIKFRSACKTTLLLRDLNVCVDIIAMPLLEVFKRTATLIDQLGVAKANAHNFKPYIESQRLCCCIFYSLNYLELHECFKDHLSEWMVEFKKYLTPTPDEYDFIVDGHQLDELRAAVCEVIGLYVIKDEELYPCYLSGVVEVVVNLLVWCSSHGNRREHLIVTAIKLLIRFSKSRHHALLSGGNTLNAIFGCIVVRNLVLQDEEEDLYNMDPMEYIKRDMEGCDVETRRGIACELLKEIATRYKEKISLRFQRHIGKFRELHASDIDADWKYYNDCTLRLVVSLATISSGLVHVESFFDSFVLPKINLWDANPTMMKAEILRFFTLLGNQISKQRVLSFLPRLCGLLTSSDRVLHSYAAIFIEKLLLVTDDDGASNRYTTDDIIPICPTLMSDLFRILRSPKSQENVYVMKCIMRVVCVGDLTATVDVALCIEGLASILLKVCQKPKNSEFKHYLFESLSSLIRRVNVFSRNYKKNKKNAYKAEKFHEIISHVSLLEKRVFPGLHMILERDIRVFFPYAFRLLSELGDLSIPVLTKYYSHIFDTFRLPDTWTRSTMFPVSSKSPPPPNPELSVLGLYNKLVLPPATEDHGFNVLNIVVENFGFEAISPFVRNVWISLHNRLLHRRRVKSVRNTVVLMSLFLLKDGPRNLVDSVNAVQPNGFEAILEQVWIPNLKLIEGGSCIELKLTLAASTRLICECADILDKRLWGKILDSIMTLLSLCVNDEPEIPEFGETRLNFFAARLYEAEKLLKEMKDPRQVLVVSLSSLFAASDPGKKDYHKVISESLEQANQSALLELFNTYNVSFF